MTELNKNDKLLHDFFAENKQEIADNGFGRRVMHSLPKRNHSTHLCSTVVTLIGVILFFRFNGLEAIWKTLCEVFYTTIQHQSAQLDMKSIIIAAAVLFVLATQKIVSMA